MGEAYSRLKTLNTPATICIFSPTLWHLKRFFLLRRRVNGTSGEEPGAKRSAPGRSFRVPTAVKNIGCGWYGSKDVKILTPNTGFFKLNMSKHNQSGGSIGSPFWTHALWNRLEISLVFIECRGRPCFHGQCKHAMGSFPLTTMVRLSSWSHAA